MVVVTKSAPNLAKAILRQGGPLAKGLQKQFPLFAASILSPNYR